MFLVLLLLSHGDIEVISGPKKKIKTVVNYKVIVFLALLLLSHGDIEVISGPKKFSKLSCCHWNVNSILAHNKLSLITVYNTVQKFDVICVSETYLNSSVNENLLLIPGYHLLRADHPDNLKKGKKT